LLEIPVATTYRVLRLLERTGYVEQHKTSKEYRLTLKFFELGCEVASKTTIRDVATVEIERLADQTGMTTNLGVLVGGDVLYLSKIETDDLLTLNLPPGSRAPATCTAMGKAMLAFDTRPVESIVGEGPYNGRTDYSIRTLDALKKELTAIQSAGYAVDRQELAVGLWCVAASIPGPRDGQEGAISVSAYRPGMDEVESEELGEIVVGFASRISSRIGDLGQMGDLGPWFR
jgi:IclR family acetate operon transcriptional repressor